MELISKVLSIYKKRFLRDMSRILQKDDDLSLFLDGWDVAVGKKEDGWEELTPEKMKAIQRAWSMGQSRDVNIAASVLTLLFVPFVLVVYFIGWVAGALLLVSLWVPLWRKMGRDFRRVAQDVVERSMEISRNKVSGHLGLKSPSVSLASEKEAIFQMLRMDIL